MGSNLVQRSARNRVGRRVAAVALLASCAVSLPALAVVSHTNSSITVPSERCTLAIIRRRLQYSLNSHFR